MSNLIKQLYSPSKKIPQVNRFMRLISILIIKIFFLDKLQRFSNVFQQLLQTKLLISINGHKIFLKDGNERLYLFAKTAYILEKDTTEWICSFNKKDIFYDIGSNVGMFSLLAAKNKANVFSFECLPGNLNSLHYNITLNNLNKNISIIPLALSNSNKISFFSARDLTASTARSYLSDEFENKLGFKTIKTTIDTMISVYKLPLPNKVKIDVDGHEREILFGFKKNIKHVKEILIEMYDTDEYDQECYSDIVNTNIILTKNFKKNYHRKINKENFHKNFYSINSFLNSNNFFVKSQSRKNILYVRK